MLVIRSQMWSNVLTYHIPGPAQGVYLIIIIVILLRAFIIHYYLNQGCSCICCRVIRSLSGLQEKKLPSKTFRECTEEDKKKQKYGE